MRSNFRGTLRRPNVRIFNYAALYTAKYWKLESNGEYNIIGRTCSTILIEFFGQHLAKK
jgi:hypothetical protein